MKKRLAKVLALGLTAAMVAGTPLSAMASEVAADVPQLETVTEEAETVQSDAGIAPQYLDDSNEEPVIGGVDPMSMNGLVQLNDAGWYTFDHGSFLNFTGLYQNSAGWWFVRDGKVDFSYTGLYEYAGSDWYVQNGQIQFGYTGVAMIRYIDGNSNQEEDSPYYIVGGRVDANFTGLVNTTINGENAWYYFRNGEWEQYENTLAEYGGSWWYVDEGKINFGYEGIAWYNDAEWYVNGGRVDFNFTGRVEGYQKVAGESLTVPFQIYFVNGMQQMDLTGVYYTDVNGVYDWYGFHRGQLATRDWYYGPTIGYVLSNGSGWWYIDPGTGKVDFSYTGMAANGYGVWYMNNGQIDFGYNGFYKQRPYGLTYDYDYYDLYAVSGGKADCNYDGIVWTTIDGVPGWYGFYDGMLATDVALLKKDDGTWWYVGDNGMVDFGYTGGANATDGNEAYGTYYIENGQINFGFTGTVREGEGIDFYDYYQNGKQVDWDFTGLVETSVNGEYGWYYVEYGSIYRSGETYDKEYSDLVPNEYGWWAVYDGKVDFDYTGFVRDSVNDTNGMWYVRNGQIDFSGNGFIKVNEDTYFYVTNGYADFSRNTVVYAEVAGETAWWGVYNGVLYLDDMEDIAEYGGKVWYYTNSKIDFNKSGTWCISRGYYDHANDRYDYIVCRYEIVNGQVVSMTAELEQSPQ